MTLSLILACLWAVASTVVALLPMRHQYVPGVALLIAAPILILWVGFDYGWWVSILALIAFVSMFRNPLRYLWKRALGHDVEIPKR